MACVSHDLRIAILGYGLAGSTFHAPLIGAVPGLRVAAVVTSDAARAAQARAAVPDAVVLPSAQEVLASPDRYDAVVVATPNRTHVPLATAAVEAGLPVVVDKPLATTAADAQALADLAEARGVLLTTYQNRRWDSDFRTLRGLVESGVLGRVHRFESRFERWRPVPKPGWRESGDPADAGGLLNDLGSHLVDQALVLFGPVRSVFAEVDVLRPGVAVDDDVLVCLEHESGVRSALWASALAGDLGPRFRALGDRGAYVVHGLDGQEAALRAGRTPRDEGWGEVPETQWGIRSAGDDREPVPSTPGAWQEFYLRWRDALRGQGPVPVDPRDAVAMLAVIDAARRSAVERQVVTVRG
jgi:predicted dehydrogenase